MLPHAVKSLPEIAEIEYPVVRVLFSGTLLETLLRSITADGSRLTLDPLIDAHQEKFSSFRAVDGARWVRNQIAHGTGLASPSRIRDAEVDFVAAIRKISEYCPPALRLAALGSVQAPAPPPAPPPIPIAPAASPNFVPPPPKAVFTPPSPPPQPKSSAGWFIFGGVFLIAAVAFFVYQQTGSAPIPAQHTFSPPTSPQPPISAPNAARAQNIIQIRPLPSPEIPPGETVRITTESGDVTTNNFFKTAVKIIESAVYIRDGQDYVIIYSSQNNEFGITLLATELSQAQSLQDTAEEGFVTALGITRTEACKLKVDVSVPGSYNREFGGQFYRLSFCPGWHHY